MEFIFETIFTANTRASNAPSSLTRYIETKTFHLMDYKVKLVYDCQHIEDKFNTYN